MRNYHYAKEGEVMYHTGLTKELLAGARYAVVPGDPGRVPGLAKALDPSAVFLTSHRDYTSWLARVSGEPVLVMSTGMGGPCMSFAVEELARLGVTTFLRAGTTGSIQEGLELGDLVIDRASVRRDGASKAYAPAEYPAVADMTVTLALMKAAESLRVPYQVGISVSTDSFWPGQERYDSFSGYVRTSYQGLLSDFQAMGCTNFEMGLRAGSVCGVVAKRTESESIAPPEVYALAEERFQKTVKRALEMLIGHFMVTL